MTAWGRQQRPCAPFYCLVISTSWIPCAHPEDEAEGRGHGAACLDKRAPTRIAGSVNLGPANSTLCALHEDRSLLGSRAFRAGAEGSPLRSEEHTSELQSLMRTSYAVFCLQKKKQKK